MTLQTRGIQAIAAFGTQGLNDARVAEMMRRGVDRVILVFDSDRNGAGQAGALKAGKLLFKAGIGVEIITLPLDDGEDKTDPNSYFQNHALEDFERLERRPFFDCQLDTIKDVSPERQHEDVRSLCKIASYRPPLLWKHYTATIHKKLPAFDKRWLEKEIALAHRCRVPENKSLSDKFLPMHFVERFKADSRILYYNNGFYTYEDGYYKFTPKERIDQKSVRYLGPDAQWHQVDNIRKFLATETFHEADQVNRLGLLNLTNGLLDLQNEKWIEEHSPEFLCTVRVNVTYDPKAEAPLWLKFLGEVLPEKSSQNLLAQIFGYCLTADTSFHKAFLFFGTGATGSPSWRMFCKRSSDQRIARSWN